MGVFYKTTKNIGKRSRSGRTNADGLSQYGASTVSGRIGGNETGGDRTTDMNALLEMIEGNMKSVVREYPSVSLFPQSGLPNTLYIDASTGATYRWDGEQYAVMGGYAAGDGISINGSVISNTHTHLTSEEIDSICI